MLVVENRYRSLANAWHCALTVGSALLFNLAFVFDHRRSNASHVPDSSRSSHNLSGNCQLHSSSMGQ